MVTSTSLVLLSLLCSATNVFATFPVSEHGFCGSLVKHTCKGSKFGDSCSKFDICGPLANPEFSGKGCQPIYGLCLSSKKQCSVKSSTTKSSSGTAVSTSSTVRATSSSVPAAATPSSISSTTIASTSVNSSSTTSSTKISATTTSTTGATLMTGAPIPTSTYTGSIAALPGTPVSVTNPSFEQTRKRKRSRIESRQSDAELAAGTDGWGVRYCNGAAGSCAFENYDAPQGVWAWSASNGGQLYQDNLNLAIGGTYSFSWYIRTNQYDYQRQTITAAFLGPTGVDTSGTIIGGQPAQVPANATWQQITSSMTIDCQLVGTAPQSANGTATFRFSVGGQTCPQALQQCYVQPPAVANYTMFLDYIRIQQTTAPSSVMTCGSTS